jgi:acyl-CoA thioester hydrolase
VSDSPPPPVIAAPFESDFGTVPPAWIDRNGHVNVSWYLFISEKATGELYELLGLDDAQRAQSGCGMFAAEHHIVYTNEMREGDRVRVTSLLLDYDHKRIHFVNRVLCGSDGAIAAAVENIELHVDLTRRRVAPFAPEVRLRLEAVRAAHKALASGAGISRNMVLPRRPRHR